MKNGILLLNGEPYRGEIDAEGSLVYCCDGAYAWARDRVRIDENIGDFDSLFLEPVPKPHEIYPSEKNFTDGEIAMQKLLEAGMEHITIYGGGGGRMDHFLGNLHLLYYAHLHGVSCVMKNNDATLFITDQSAEFRHEKGKTISILPFGGNACVAQSEGLKYPLIHLPLNYGACRGISNVIEEDFARIRCERGVVLVIVNEVNI